MRFLLALLFLVSCSGSSVEYSALEIKDDIPSETIAESIITPYRDSLEQTMNMVLVYNEQPLNRSIPESNLGNLVADLLLERALLESSSDVQPDFCLINIGGLRVDIPKGPITVGKAFELMPFENELDIIEITPEKTLDLIAYLKEVGGQPLSGIQLKFTDTGFECLINGAPLDPQRSYRVVTSDYLADGGDKMTFFANPLIRIRTGVKIRDAIIDHFRILGLADNSLVAETDGRLTFE